MAVAQGFKERSLPLSMIVVDWRHWVQLGDMSLNPTCWPDPAGASSALPEIPLTSVEGNPSPQAAGNDPF